MKRFRMTVDGKCYEIEILNDPRADEVSLTVDGKEFTVTAQDLEVEAAAAVPAAASAPVTAPAPKPAAPSAAPVEAGANTVKAPLPGVINAVKVCEGQKVKLNDPLVVIEAMKAMNVIHAQHSGTVTKIYVSDGSRVAYGAPLLDIE